MAATTPWLFGVLARIVVLTTEIRNGPNFIGWVVGGVNPAGIISRVVEGTGAVLEVRCDKAQG